MKDIIKKITESAKNNNLFSEVQNVVDKDGEYHTYDCSAGQQKFNKGFLIYNEEINSFIVIGFNTAKEFAAMEGTDISLYKGYERMNVGDCKRFTEDDGSQLQIIRMW